MLAETLRNKYEKLATEYSISAREYFMILRLAIYHITGEHLETALDITQYVITEDIYRVAIRILKALNGELR